MMLRLILVACLLALVPAAINAQSSNCSDAFGSDARVVELDNRCYAFITSTKRFEHAKKYCKDTVSGGSLALVKSSKVDNFLYDVIKKNYLPAEGPNVKGQVLYMFWIGLEDLRRRDVYTWVDGSDLDYDNFSSGYDDPYQKKYAYYVNCAGIGPDGTWYKNTCMGYTTKCKFICEYPASA